MKKYYILRVILSFIFPSLFFFNPLSAQELNWAKKIGGTGSENTWAIAHNSNGEIIITGSHYATTMDTFNLPCANICFNLLRLDSSGTVKQVISNPNAVGLDVKGDANGNMIATGYILANTNFSGVNLITRGGSDAFLASFKPDGSLNWVITAGGANNDYGHKLITDSNGDILLAGKFWQKMYFPSGDSLIAPYPYNGNFIAKIKGSDGSLLWAKYMYSTGASEIKDIKLDAEGNILLTGLVSISLKFDGATLTTNGGEDILLMKLNTDGSLKWMKSVGGKLSQESGTGIAIDESSNIYLTGYFQDTAHFDSTVFLRSYGSRDVFLAQYKPNGDLIWAKRYGGNNGEQSASLVLEKHYLYINGIHGDYSQFGDTVLRSKSPGADVFIAKFDSVGEVKWIFSGGSRLTETSKGLSFYKDNLYIIGEFGISINGTTPTAAEFGGFSITTPNGHPDIFLLKFSLNDDNIGIKEFFNSPKPFAVYPNPVKARSPYLTIDLPLQHNSRISVYNTTGKLMHTAQLNRNSTRGTVQLPDLTPGMYFLRLNSGNQIFHSKIILE